MRLPNSDKSRAVIVGTSLYQPNSGFEPLPAVTNNLHEVADFLRTQTGLRHVDVVENPADNSAIIDTVRPAVHVAEDLLLFYYAGHGVPLGTGDVGLTHTASRSDGPGWSTLHYAELRHEIRATRAPIKIVILDSCHSGRAFGSGALATTDQNEALRELVEIEGAYVLTATNSTQKFASAAGVDGCTAFTGALLEVMRTGADSSDRHLTMASVFPLLASKLRAAGNPAPRSSGSNNVADIALATNPSWRARTLVAVDFDNLTGQAMTGSGAASAVRTVASVAKHFADAYVAIFVARPDRDLHMCADELRADLFWDPTGSNRFRAKGLSVQMAVYVMDQLSRLSKLVLVSGDSDFIPVLTAAKHAGIPTVLVGARENTAKRLIEAADEFVPFSQLDEPAADVFQRGDARARFAHTHTIGEIVPEVGIEAGHLPADRDALLKTPAFTLEQLRALRGDAATATARVWLARRRDSREVFTVTLGNKYLIPAFQLDDQGRPRAELHPVISALIEAGLDGWSQWAWLTTPTELLSGGIPEQVARSDPERVLRAAERYCAGGNQGPQS